MRGSSGAMPAYWVTISPSTSSRPAARSARSRSTRDSPARASNSSAGMKRSGRVRAPRLDPLGRAAEHADHVQPVHHRQGPAAQLVVGHRRPDRVGAVGVLEALDELLGIRAAAGPRHRSRGSACTSPSAAAPAHPRPARACACRGSAAAPSRRPACRPRRSKAEAASLSIRGPFFRGLAWRGWRSVIRQRLKRYSPSILNFGSGSSDELRDGWKTGC